MRLVVDTNVLVSGLLSPVGPPGRILDGVLAGSNRLLFDDRFLAEYTTVLARPRFALDAKAVKVLLEFVRNSGELIPTAASRLRTTDPGDQPFLEVALTGSADALVTGNARHFPQRSGVRILTPAELIAGEGAR